MLKFAFINGIRNVVLSGDYDKIEIWPATRFEEFDEKYRVNLNNEYEHTLARVAELALSDSNLVASTTEGEDSVPRKEGRD